MRRPRQWTDRYAAATSSIFAGHSRRGASRGPQPLLPPARDQRCVHRVGEYAGLRRDATPTSATVTHRRRALDYRVPRPDRPIFYPWTRASSSSAGSWTDPEPAWRDMMYADITDQRQTAAFAIPRCGRSKAEHCLVGPIRAPLTSWELLRSASHPALINFDTAVDANTALRHWLQLNTSRSTANGPSTAAYRDPLRSTGASRTLSSTEMDRGGTPTVPTTPTGAWPDAASAAGRWSGRSVGRG
jgi:hypothetical protein